MTLGRELKALIVLNYSRLGMMWMTMGCELRALVAMNNSGCGSHE